MRLLKSFAVRQEKVASGEYGDRFGSVGSADHREPPDVFSHHQVGRFTKGWTRK